MQKPISSDFYSKDWAENNPFWIYGNDEKGKRRSEGIAPFLTLETFDVWDKPILDVGAGFGWLTKFLREYGANVIGLDYSQYCVDNRVSDRVMLGDMTDLSRFKDNTFDLVISRENLEHLTLEQSKKAFEEMIRVSRKWLYLTIWIETSLDATDGVIYDDFKNDKSHITVMTRNSWLKIFSEYEKNGIIIRDEEKEKKMDWKARGRCFIYSKL